MYLGLVLLCALGNLHVSWTIWRLYLYVFDYQNVETHVLLAWFVGVAGGAMFGAFLNTSWSKILIYVRSMRARDALFFPRRNAILCPLTFRLNFMMFSVFDCCGADSSEHVFCAPPSIFA